MTDPAHLRHLLARLRGVRKDGTGWSALCPAHEDDRNSLHVAIGEKDGRIVLHCHAGCAVEDVVKASGTTMAALFPPRPGSAIDAGAGVAASTRSARAFDESAVVASYDYTDETGAVLLQVQRDANKCFRQRRPDPSADPGEPTWINNAQGVRKVPYRLPEVRSAVAFGLPIMIVEGEKDADTLAAIGLVATTNAGGAGKWTDEHSAALKGATVAYVLPDADDAGRKHARLVRHSLRGKVGHVRIVELPDLPSKGDVSDWIAAGGTRAALEALLAAPSRLDGWSSFVDLVERDLPDTDWILEDYVSKPSIVVLSGDKGACKSWTSYDFAIGAALGGKFVGHFRFEKRYRTMIVSADEDVAESRRKISYLLASMPSENGSRDALHENTLLWNAPMNMADDETFARLLDDVADFAPDVVMFDHLRLMLPGNENDSEFGRAVKEKCEAIFREHPCAIILVHHWRKPVKEKALNRADVRARGSTGILAVAHHHIALIRDDFGVVTLQVSRNRKGPEPDDVCFVPRIQREDGKAWLEYMGPAVSVGADANSAAAEIKRMIDTPTPTMLTQPEARTALQGRFSSDQITRAFRAFRNDRDVYLQPSKGRAPTSICMRRHAIDLFVHNPANPAMGGAEGHGPEIDKGKPYKD